MENKRPDVLIFVSGLLGELVLKELDDRNLRPLIAAAPAGSLRRRETGDIAAFSSRFELYETSGPTFAECAASLPHVKAAAAIDWPKNFFRPDGAPYPVYYSQLSLLPFYRGYGAVSEQFVRGVCVSGVTFYLDDGRTDAGDIVYQEKVSIAQEDYPADFIAGCAPKCADFIEKLCAGEALRGVRQNEDKAFYLPRIRNKIMITDFNASAVCVYNFIRAYSYPFPGAVFYHKGELCRAEKCSVEKWNGTYGAPGEVIAKTDYGIEVACGEGTVIIGRLRKAVSVDAVFSDIEEGDFLD